MTPTYGGQGEEHGSLSENVLPLHMGLNSWFLVARAVQQGLGSVALLGEVCHRG